MRRILCLLLILLFIASSLQAQGTTQFRGGGCPSGATCSTKTTPSNEDNNYTYDYSCQASGLRKYATKFVADSGTGTVCKFCLQMQKAGSPTMTINAKIFDDNSDKPGSMVTGGDFGSMSASSIVDATFNCFTGGSASLTNGTAYWLVLECSTYDGSNYFTVTQDDVCTTEHNMRYDGSNWYDISTTRCGMMQLYK